MPANCRAYACVSPGSRNNRCRIVGNRRRVWSASWPIAPVLSDRQTASQVRGQPDRRAGSSALRSSSTKPSFSVTTRCCLPQRLMMGMQVSMVVPPRSDLGASVRDDRQVIGPVAFLEDRVAASKRHDARHGGEAQAVLPTHAAEERGRPQQRIDVGHGWIINQ
jgi:hypothetical protein